MAVTLSNYLESIVNPKACFKTLGGIFPLRNAAGEPVFALAEHTVKFDMEWEGRRYRLNCFLRGSSEESRRAWALCNDPGIANNRFIPTTRYLTDEILVFEDNGRAVYHDVVLQEVVEGKPFDLFMIECSEKNDKQLPREVLQSLAQMSEWLYSQRLIHQKIRLPNLVVRPDHSLVLVNLDMMRRLTPEEIAENPNAFGADNLAIGYLAVLLFVVSCTPKTYALLRQGVFRRLRDMKKVLPAIDKAAKVLGMSAIEGLIARLMRSNGKLRDRERLGGEIRGLIAQLPSKNIDSTLLTAYSLRFHAAPKLRDVIAQYETKPEKCDRRVNWAALPADTLVRVESEEGNYFYTDTTGKRMIDAEYDFAYDFAEGRAVVVMGSDYALIDRNGVPVIPFICEDLEWDADNGVAKAMIDGKWGLFNRSGELIVPLRYDWMGSFGDDLLVAKEGDHYGYLRRDGAMAIPFVYDDAYSFDFGVALVEKGGKQFLIDTEGNPIEGASVEHYQYIVETEKSGR